MTSREYFCGMPNRKSCHSAGFMRLNRDLCRIANGSRLRESQSALTKDLFTCFILAEVLRSKCSVTYVCITIRYQCCVTISQSIVFCNFKPQTGVWRISWLCGYNLLVSGSSDGSIKVFLILKIVV